MAQNSSKEICPSPFASNSLINLSKSTRCAPSKTYFNSSADISPDPSLSNILNAAASFSIEVSDVWLSAAVQNSEKLMPPDSS